MTHDEDEFARKIKGYLDAGTADLRAGTAYRLQQARAGRARPAGRAAEASPSPASRMRWPAAVARAAGSGRSTRRCLVWARRRC